MDCKKCNFKNLEEIFLTRKNLPKTIGNPEYSVSLKMNFVDP